MPNSCAVILYLIAESISNAQEQLSSGTPLLSRSEAEQLLSEIENTTGKRHYIFMVRGQLERVTA